MSFRNGTVGEEKLIMREEGKKRGRVGKGKWVIVEKEVNV